MTASSKILIVDDEADLRTILAKIFERAGYAVATAANGLDAISRCAEEDFDVVLSDVMMPEMNGHELAQWVRANRPTTQFALMSGFLPDGRGCTSTVRCEVIPKPFRPKQVVEFIGLMLAT